MFERLSRIGVVDCYFHGKTGTDQLSSGEKCGTTNVPLRLLPTLGQDADVRFTKAKCPEMKADEGEGYPVS